MHNWSLTTEAFSLIVGMILLISFLGKRTLYMRQSKFFLVCLGMTVAATALNITTVLTMDESCGMELPLFFKQILNSAYFLMMMLMVTTIAYYLLQMIYEHIYEAKAKKWISRFFVALTGIYTLLVLLNPWLCYFFYFDVNGDYRRGPLNAMGYVLMGIEATVILICALSQWEHLGDSTRHVLRMLPPSVALLSVFQLLFPDNLLNGVVSSILCKLEQISCSVFSIDRLITCHCGLG